MKMYDAYKPSGVKWIELVPSHWTNLHIKYTTNGKGGLFIDGDWIESKDLASDGIRYLTSGNVGVIKYKEQGDGYITEDKFKELNCTEVFPGDILISRLNEPIGRACIVPELDSRIVVAVDNVICRVNESLHDKRYLVYEMNCKAYSDYTNCLARGTGMHRISRGMLGQINIVIPPLDEQTAIANYLDSKCAKIDNVVAVQQKRIELLKELKQSIITKAVTKGLDKNAKMKDSGIDWIGEVPEGWKVMKTSWIFKIGSGTTPKSGDKRYYAEEDGINWLQTGDLNDGVIMETSKHITEQAVQDYNLKTYSKGSLVIAMYGATIGKVGLLKIDTTVNQACCVLNKSKKMTEKYAFYVFQAGKPALLREAYGGGQPNISQDIISTQKYPLPSPAEQTAIVAYLDKKCATIDKQIAKVEKQIELLYEYKQSVITECVTGKRKVC